MEKQKGFTLIELLVVIAIIGLLSTLAVVSLNNARAKSRDSKRVADVKQIQTSLELYFNDFTSYPQYLTTSGMSNYLATPPKQPTPADGTCPAVAAETDYEYTADGSAPYASYHITFCLGGRTGGLESGPRTATPAGIQ